MNVTLTQAMGGCILKYPEAMLEEHAKMEALRTNPDLPANYWDGFNKHTESIQDGIVTTSYGSLKF